MRSRIFALALLIVCAFLLAGCQTSILVHNATTKQLIPVFKDYVGSHGYSITYANDQTGSYHLDMGAVFISGISAGSSSTSTYVSGGGRGSHQPMTAYEESSWNSSSNPAHYEEATAAVNIIQQGKDVLINIDTNSAGGTSLDDIKDYLRSLGYSVD
jgi:hypothetical protein